MREQKLLRQDLHPEAVRSALIGAFEASCETNSWPSGPATRPLRRAELRAAFKAVLECFLQSDGS